MSLWIGLLNYSPKTKGMCTGYEIQISDSHITTIYVSFEVYSQIMRMLNPMYPLVPTIKFCIKF